jgi:hypothetical protein
MTLDELLLEWSYRSEKGYPSMGSPSDISVLKGILRELKLPEWEINELIDNLEEDNLTTTGTDGMEDSSVEKEKEKQVQTTFKSKEEPEPKPELKPKTGTSSNYDELILRHLGVDQIPQSKHTYKYAKGGATYVEQVKADDLDIWQKLWTAKPDKKTETGVGTAGVGNGEVSLYWLYNHSQSDVNVSEGREGDDPDLFFNGNGVEVKAYPSHDTKLSIGRYGADKENLRLLSTIFGMSTLTRVFGNIKEDKTINPTNFNGNDLIEAFKSVASFSNVDLEQLSGIYPIFQQIKDNLDYLDSKLQYNNAEEGALAMGRKFLKDKLARKPGDGNHLVNIKKDGSMKFYLVSFNKIDSDKDVLNKMSSSQSAMKLNFSKIFN